ncbi:hypothetical protein KA005_09300 [bacterium]|jgi:dimeric dUTPase (all-alpha-NTP-PPase superfamily)|nr:hypothetical protein [bacterium]
MKIRYSILILMFSFVVVTGCSSVAVQRGKDLSSAGVAYSEATASLIDVAIDSMVNADSEAFVRTKLRPEALTRPEYSVENLQDRLAKSNIELISNTKQLLILRASVGSVGSYFKALQSLADNPQSDTTSSAVSTLSDRVNSLNVVLNKGEGSVKPVISEAQKTALSGLAKLVADQVHGKKVATALKRDAHIIGEAILLQEQILSLAEKVIIGDLNSKTNKFYVDKVQRPFEKQTIDENWVNHRRVYVKAKATGEISTSIKAARDASKQMGDTWNKILSGVYDVSEMRQQIEDIESIVTTMLALKQAEKPKAPVN